MLTTESLRKFAKEELGVDALGVANIERFANAPEYMHPAQIMPEVKSVIVFTRRILRVEAQRAQKNCCAEISHAFSGHSVAGWVSISSLCCSRYLAVAISSS